MRIGYSPQVLKQLRKVKQKDPKLAKRIEKQIVLLQENPKHHSLRLHDLSGNLENLWSISIAKNIRMVYRHLKGDIAFFTKIGTHDEVYKK